MQQAGLLTQQQANDLIAAYCHIRDAAHRLTLGKETRIVDHKRFASDREIVIAIWNQLFGE